MMKIYICGALLSSSLTYATVASPPVMHPELSEAINLNKSKAPIIHTEQDLSLYEITAALRYDQTSFKQSGTGQQYDTASASGTSVLVNGVKKISDNYLRAQLQHSESTFREPDDVGGKNVGISRQNISFSFGKNISSFSIDGGLGLTKQSTDTFSTGTALVPEYLQIGPQIGLRYAKYFSKNWVLEPHITVLIPVYFSESGDSSGSHNWGLQTAFGANFRGRLNRYLHFLAGVTAEFERHSFSGSGERGVSDATVDYEALTFPVGISYVF